MAAAARDTIFALSSGPLPAAIAVVRVSGPDAGPTLARLAGKLPPVRRAVAAKLRHEGEIIDRAMILWLPGPGTSTGEDVAELHLHGSRAVVAKLLATLGKFAGLRMAEPGEFTRRAFLNGRLDLTQSEGLADLLAAETEAQRRQAMRQAEGGLGRQIEGWRTRLLACSAQVEAAIEFAEEEEDVPTDPTIIRARIGDLLDDIAAALAQPPAERLRDGVRIVLAGPVNAGKSTLINGLAGRDAAIASPVAGTTRDLIEVPVALAGMPCLLIDSAGLREQAGQVEQLGIARTQAALADADLILWLGKATDCRDRDRSIVVQAKCDISSGPEAGADVAVSAVTGANMSELREMIEHRVRKLLPRADAIALNARHRAHLVEAATELAAALKVTDLLLVAEHLRLARLSLDRVTGRAGVEEMLDSLFGQFCIGK